MQLVSPAFKDQQSLPEKFTCKGDNFSPPLHFKNVPQGTESLALLVDDPDSPSGTFIHWLIWNVEPDTTKIAERSGLGFRGRNDFGVIGYKGPCSPIGKSHRYVFHLYALDKILNLPDGASRREVERAMQGHILESAQLTALFGEKEQ